MSPERTGDRPSALSPSSLRSALQADDQRGAENADPESQLSESERAERVRRALAGMSTKDRTVLTLRHFGELSYEEIAEILELDEKTVKSRLFEARHRLRGLLRDLKADSR